MKRLALTSLVVVAFLFIASCRRKLTIEEKTENAVKNYLYDSYGANVEIFGFKNFSTYKYYVEQYCREDYERLVKKFPKDSISEKKYYEKEAMGQQIGHQKWYKILCVYKLYDYSKTAENFFISPDFKKVEKQMLITLIKKREGVNHLDLANNIPSATQFQKRALVILNRPK